MNLNRANDYLEDDERDDLVVTITASLNIESDGHTSYAGPGWSLESDIPQGTKIPEAKVVAYGYTPNYGWLEVIYNGKVIRLAKGHYQLK